MTIYEREKLVSPDSVIRSPKALAIQMCRDLAAARYIAWRLFVRDLRAQYRQTALGYIWAFLPALALAVGVTLASEARILQIGTTHIPYPAYVIFGMVLWQTFTEATTGPLQAIADARTMLTKVNFPREALVLAKVASVVFNLLIKLGLVAATFAWYGIAITWTACLTPFAIVALIVFGLALGLLLAPVAALYQDFSRGLTVMLGFWFFFTPVAYATPSEGVFGRIVRMNPVTPLIDTVRNLTYGDPIAPNTYFFLLFAASVVVLLIAWVIYRVSMPIVIERMSA